MKGLVVVALVGALYGCSNETQLSEKDAATAQSNFSRNPTPEEMARAQKSRLPPPP